MITPSCDKCSATCGGVFGSLSERHVARLMEARVAHAYKPGQTLFFQGNPSLAAYCIREGRVKLSRLVLGGDEHVIATRGPGDLIGYRAVLAGRRYRVTAEPLEYTVACAIPRETLLELLRDDAELAMALLVRLSRESLKTETEMMTRAVEGVRTRLARFLLQGVRAAVPESGKEVDIPLAMSREEIARLIDTTPETLSRTLRTLAERGILEPERHHIRVMDLPALERLARLEPASDERLPTVR